MTNHGEVTAVLVPPSLSPYERLVAAGKVRAPDHQRPIDLRRIRRATTSMTTAASIADVRGER